MLDQPNRTSLTLLKSATLTLFTFLFSLTLIAAESNVITSLFINENLNKDNIESLAKNQKASILKDKNHGVLFANLSLSDALFSKHVAPDTQFIYLFNVSGVKNLSIDLADKVHTFYVDQSEFETGLSLGANLSQQFIIQKSVFKGAVVLYGSENANETHYAFLENQFLCDKSLQLIDFSSLYGKSFKINKNLFSCELSIMDLMVSDWINITGSIFSDGVTFINNEMPASFDFYFNTVDGPAFFPAIDFEKPMSLSQSKFSNEVVLHSAKFLDSVNLTWASFNGGLDLQFSKFGPKSKLYVAHMKIPDGKLKFNADEFERLLHNNLVSDDNNLSNRIIENIYENFISQYLSQNNKQAADTVSYFYEVFKQKAQPSFTHWLYGISMGYGYKLWHYVLTVVTPITFICTLIMGIYFRREIHKLVARSHQVSEKETIYPDTLTSMVRTLSVTSSILFSIRFKTVWISENKAFNFAVMLNYLIGLGLYVAFLLGTKTSSFDVIKALAGV